MANWASTAYAIKGPKETLEKINEAILHPNVEEGSDERWEGNILRKLDIKWKQSSPDGSGYYMRGFILDKPWWHDTNHTILRFSAEEAWGATDLDKVLEDAFPDIKVFYSVEEENECIYATNDKDGEFFPDRYYVETCINGNYQMEYFINETSVYDWLSYLTYGKIKTKEDVDEFNESVEESGSDDFISIYEYEIIE